MYTILASLLFPLTMYTIHQAWLQMYTRQRMVSRRRACVDIINIDDAIRLVRALSQPTSDANFITERVDSVLRRFPPDEYIMRRLSMFQQDVTGEGGEREFCIVTVFMIASLCIEDGIHRPLHPRRTNSLPMSFLSTKHRDGNMECRRGYAPHGGTSEILHKVGTHSATQTASSQCEFY